MMGQGGYASNTRFSCAPGEITNRHMDGIAHLAVMRLSRKTETAGSFDPAVQNSKPLVQCS
jgi:hypothetical protein